MANAFTGEGAILYAKLADSASPFLASVIVITLPDTRADHRHPRGPWPLMLAAVEGLKLPAGATVLDVASGPGEPALTIAKALPHLSARCPASAAAPVCVLTPCDGAR